MKNIHPEFAYQARELGAQIEDTLGDPPDRKRYRRVLQSLVAEFSGGSAIDDVNLLSFALHEYLVFNDPAGLLAQSANYESGDAEKTFGMVSCADDEACKALTTVLNNNPELARQAIVTAFLFKHSKYWANEDHSLEALQKEEDEDDDEDEDDHLDPGHDIEHLFDARGDDHA